jgi:glycerol-3-phosphate dehydrogenase
MEQNDFDVIVVGGGIQGAGCAQAAAAAGYRVCLLEQNTWGSGTSSRSSKLIHGGLRYLETFQFGLVRKALNERKILVQIAQSLVHPVPFYIPVYAHSKHQAWKIFVGLSLYSLLGGFDSLARFRRVPKHEWEQLNGLNITGLKQVFQYWDTQTDDQLLTRAVVQSAEKLGASVHQGADFVQAEPHANGYQVTYTKDETTYQLKCQIIVNAAGPWAAELQNRIQSAPAAPQVELVQGAHIELTGRVSEGIFYIESPRDRRAVFIMPWYDNTLVGTTETAFSGDPANTQATDEEVAYLLEALQHYFPDFQAKLVNSFAGLRVLPKLSGSFSARPRDTVVQYDNERKPTVITLYGGKLTAYRATADKILAQMHLTLGQPRADKKPQSTREIDLYKPA